MKCSLLIVVLSLSSMAALADAGNCVRYYVEVEFKDSSSIIGHLFLLEYLTAIPEADAELWEAMNKYPRLQWELYRSLHEVVLSNHFGLPLDSTMLAFNACTAEDAVIFQMKDVKRIKILKVAPCRNDADSRGYYSKGIYPVMVSDLIADELELLTTGSPISNHFSLIDQELTYFILVAELNKEDMLAISQQVRTQLQSDMDSKKDRTNSFQILKQKLREKKIILLQFGFGD